VGAEVEDCSLVDLCSLVFRCIDLRVVFYEITDSLNKVTVFLLGLEKLLFGEVGKAN
jgi:hypothetical protein